MTTIAANLESRAADSMTIHDLQMMGTHRKVHVVGDKIVGYSGCMDSGILFLGWVERGMNKRGLPRDLSEEFTGMILDRSGLWEYKGFMVPMRIEGGIWATGSGALAAMGAMRMGADPKRAVEISAELDPFTGGPVVVEPLLRS